MTEARYPTTQGPLRILDLFCGAGGCSFGYALAGFEPVGVDLRDQKDYPFEFIGFEALAYLKDMGRSIRRRFDAVHASPPCQGYSRAMKHLSHPTALLLEPVREALKELGLPYVIENVPGAPIGVQPDLFGGDGFQICGTAFGLRVYRHRLFESNLPLFGTHCNHRLPALNPHNQKGRDRIYAEFGRGDPEAVWRQDMGVGWMSRYDAREAIPPTYTEFIGKQLRAHIEGVPVETYFPALEAIA